MTTRTATTASSMSPKMKAVPTKTTTNATTTELIRHLTDDFQYLVAAIAFFYVLCQLPMMIESILMLNGVETGNWMTRLNYTAFVFNSTFNLPLYLIFSRKMRFTFFQILKDARKNIWVVSGFEETSLTSVSTRNNMDGEYDSRGGIGDGCGAGSRGGERVVSVEGSRGEVSEGRVYGIKGKEEGGGGESGYRQGEGYVGEGGAEGENRGSSWEEEEDDCGGGKREGVGRKDVGRGISRVGGRSGSDSGRGAGCESESGYEDEEKEVEMMMSEGQKVVIVEVEVTVVLGEE